jgi:hypothetical protein
MLLRNRSDKRAEYSCETVQYFQNVVEKLFRMLLRNCSEYCCETIQNIFAKLFSLLCETVHHVVAKPFRMLLQNCLLLRNLSLAFLTVNLAI